MTIRQHTIGIISSILLLMIISIYGANRFILLEGYLRLERTDAEKRATQLFNQLNGELSRLKTIAVDWAPWDDTYLFVQNHDPTYIEKNLQDSTVGNLRVNFMLFFDLTSTLVTCKAMDMKEDAGVDCTESLTSLLLRYPDLARKNNGDVTVSGIFKLDSQFLLLAASPILTSRFEGPVRGTLIVGEYFDETFIDALGEKLKLDLRLVPLESNGLIPGLNPMDVDRLVKDRTVITTTQDTVSSICLFKNPQHDPVAAVEIVKDRSIFKQGKISLSIFLWSLVAIGLAFLGATLLFLDKYILRKIASLSDDVARIASTGDDQKRVALKGHDEISSLSLELNAMLDKIWEGQKRYQTLFESASDAILLLKEDRIVDCNLKAVEFFGVGKQDIIGNDPCGFSPERQPDGELSRTKCKKLMEKGLLPESLLFDWVYLRKDGTPRDAEVHLTGMSLPSGFHFQAIIRDTTERKNTLRMITQTEKMMSIGGLALGMAHEINNPLSGMMQNAQVVVRRFSPDVPANHTAAEEAGTTLEAMRHYMDQRGVFRMLNSINTAGEKAAEIVRNMLQFVRNGISEKSDCNVAIALERALDLAQKDFNLQTKYDYKTIHIIREYQKNLPLIPCEQNNLQHAFLNIIKNAAQAMFNHGAEGRKPLLILRASMEPAHMRIEIEDNGKGMDAETKKRIFEPFFTTRETGQGTGLGLSIAFFIIVDDHGGDISVESSPGKGTNVIIRLPSSSVRPARGRNPG